MKSFTSILAIALIIIAYGRCVADQFGVLRSTEIACCQASCAIQEHETNSAEGDHHDDVEGNDCPDSHDPSEEPSPCQFCFILGNDGMLLSNHLDVPSPIFIELTPLFSDTLFDSFLYRTPLILDSNIAFLDYPDPSDEQYSLLRRIVVKALPVRGPSIV